MAAVVDQVNECQPGEIPGCLEGRGLNGDSRRPRQARQRRLSVRSVRYVHRVLANRLFYHRAKSLEPADPESPNKDS